MKFTFYSLLIISVFLFTACSTRKVEEKNIQGVVIKKYSVLKKDVTKKQGKFEAFYDSGKPLEIAEYKDGALNGERTLFFENGKTMIVEHYDMDKMQGDYESYFENGNLKQKGTYADNKIEGIWNNYYEQPAGQIKESFTLKNGIINGVYKEFATNGKLITEGNKIEISDGLDVLDGKVIVYDSISGKAIYNYLFDKGKLIQKDSIQ